MYWLVFLSIVDLEYLVDLDFGISIPNLSSQSEIISMYAYTRHTQCMYNEACLLWFSFDTTNGFFEEYSIYCVVHDVCTYCTVCTVLYMTSVHTVQCVLCCT